MSQHRYINTGATADADKVNSINRNLFAPQLLRADNPFMYAASANQVALSPHSAIFQSGVVLDEDETLLIDIDTGFYSFDLTIYYEHVDEDQVGGSAAILDTASGLLTSRPNSVILGWIRYPGGSVAVDNSMLFPNSFGQVRAGSEVANEVHRSSQDGAVIASSSFLSSSSPEVSLGNVIPGSPYQITNSDVIVSRRIAFEGDQQLRVFNRDDGIDMERVVTSPDAGEYSVNVSTGVFTFNATDGGKTVDISDITYGVGLSVTENSSPSEATEDILFTFPASNVPIRTLSFRYVVLDDYTIDLVEVLDVNGSLADVIFDKVEPTTPDGSISQLRVRLLSGSFEGTNGQQFVARIRKVIGANGDGILLGAVASSYDLPF